MKIGIIHEGKNPPDHRTPFTPQQLQQLSVQYEGQLEFIVQKSPIRSFSDEEYEQAGIQLVDDISEADVLFGVKEVPVQHLIPEKTYFFFSHTIKKQSKNRAMLQSILEKRIRLIDYEVLKDESGNRVVAFGFWAGVVGAYNAFWTYGKKTGLFDLKRANECKDLSELAFELGQVQLPPIKIAITGSGRVGKGVLTIVEMMGLRGVNTHDFLHHYFEEPVYTVLSSSDFNRRKTDGGFDREEFYTYPERYESHFLKFAEQAELLIAAAFWNPGAPRLFEMDDINSPDFSISVIADITCDIDGSIPTTIKASSIAEPVYDIDRESGQILPPFGKQTSISVMAIDNLPCELPRESSSDFGVQLSEWVIPALLQEDAPILEKATITRDGDLTVEFIYLQDYILGKD